MYKFDIYVSDYLNFDAEILTIINVDEIDWREKVREECIRRTVINPNESLHNDQYQDIPDQEEDIESESVGIVESLDMLDKIRKCTAVDEENQAMLYSVIKKLEGLQLKKRRYFIGIKFLGIKFREFRDFAKIREILSFAKCLKLSNSRNFVLAKCLKLSNSRYFVLAKCLKLSNSRNFTTTCLQYIFS